MTTVLIEDSAIFRVAIQHILADVPGQDEVVAIAIGEMERTLIPATDPVDLMLLGGTGVATDDLQTLELARALFSPCRVLILYEAPDLEVLKAASARLGVYGFLPKSSTPEAILAAVNLVKAGGECFPRPDLAMLSQPANGKAIDEDRILSSAHSPDGRSARALTDRQQTILRLLAQGNTMRDVSDKMGISVATVKSHARTLYWKLNARNQAEATFVAIHQGLL